VVVKSGCEEKSLDNGWNRYRGCNPHSRSRIGRSRDVKPTITPMASSESAGSAREVANSVGVLSSRPPALASFILQLILPQRDRATVIGDLEQAYNADLLPKYGSVNTS
jgi:hypothetical protein